LLRVTGCI